MDYLKNWLIYDGAKKGSSETSPIGSGNYERKQKRILGDDGLKRYLDKYKNDKEVVTLSKKYKEALNTIKNFKANKDGSYDIITGKSITPKGKYSFTFHQNKDKNNLFGYYDGDTYSKMIAITIKETGAQPQIGHYGGANEISFTSDDRIKSFKFAELHNQDSVYHVGKRKNRTEFLGKTKGPITFKRNKKYNYIQGD